MCDAKVKYGNKVQVLQERNCDKSQNFTAIKRLLNEKKINILWVISYNTQGEKCKITRKKHWYFLNVTSRCDEKVIILQEWSHNIRVTIQDKNATHILYEYVNSGHQILWTIVEITTLNNNNNSKNSSSYYYYNYHLCLFFLTHPNVAQECLGAGGGGSLKSAVTTPHSGEALPLRSSNLHWSGKLPRLGPTIAPARFTQCTT